MRGEYSNIEIQSIRISRCTAHMRQLKRLYKEAFPKNERKPFPLMRLWQVFGKTEILEVRCDDDFLGLLITVPYRDLVLVDYLAVLPELRGKGIGSRTVELIRERYADKRIFLEIESTRVHSDNEEERLRRKSFYLGNGLRECGLVVRIFSAELEILTFDSEVSYDEYVRLYRSLLGVFATGRIERV